MRMGKERTTVDLGEVGLLGVGVAVAERHEDDAVVNEGGHHVRDRRFCVALNNNTSI